MGYLKGAAGGGGPEAVSCAGGERSPQEEGLQLTQPSLRRHALQGVRPHFLNFPQQLDQDPTEPRR
jgi:hypothetical protein